MGCHLFIWMTNGAVMRAWEILKKNGVLPKKSHGEKLIDFLNSHQHIIHFTVYRHMMEKNTY